MDDRRNIEDNTEEEKSLEEGQTWRSAGRVQGRGKENKEPDQKCKKKI